MPSDLLNEKKMIKYFALVFATLSKAITYKQGAGTVFSLGIATVVTSIENVYRWEYFGISYSYLLLMVALVMIDFVTGAIASRHEAKGVKGWFISEKITYTVYKFISIFLLLWLANEIYMMLESNYNESDSGFWTSIYGGSMSTLGIARTTAFTLICGREYISIGENIQRRFGKKYYAFTLFEKIFDVIEMRFIKKLEKKC